MWQVHRENNKPDRGASGFQGLGKVECSTLDVRVGLPIPVRDQLNLAPSEPHPLEVSNQSS